MTSEKYKKLWNLIETPLKILSGIIIAVIITIIQKGWNCLA